MGTGYTRIEHEIWDSDAARTLSHSARALLVDVLRVLKRENRIAEIKTPDEMQPVVFPPIAVPWMERKTQYKRLKELENKGFIDIFQQENGRPTIIAWAARWEAYTLSIEEAAAAEQRRKRANNRSTIRTGKKSPPVQGVDTPPVQGVDTPPVQGVDTPPVQGVDTPPVQGVDTFRTRAGRDITKKHNTPPLPPTGGSVEVVSESAFNIDLEESDGPPFDEILDAWNRVATTAKIQAVGTLTEKRRRTIEARWLSGHWREHWREAISRIPDSPFIRGENTTGFMGNFDWFLREGTVTKIIEGGYGLRKFQREGIYCGDSSDIIDF